MNGSNGNMISLLEKIAAKLETLDAIRDEVTGLRDELVKGFAQTNARLDNLLVFTGKSHTDLAKRVTALERKVFKRGA